MMAPVAPIVIPPDCSILNSQVSKQEWKLFTRKNWVIFISVLEMIGSFVAMTVYIYALAVEPEWFPFLVPIPSDLCNATNIVHGVMYVIVLLCAMEMVLALYLFEGARKEKLGRIRFWLSSTLTYLALVTIVILGLDLGGIRCPTMNSAAFINIFIRFLEILVVYAWAEQETMAQRMRLTRLGFGTGSRGLYPGYSTNGLSTLTICTTASANNAGIETHLEEQSPPPSYSSTIPSTTLNNYHPPPPPSSQQDLLQVP